MEKSITITEQYEIKSCEVTPNNLLKPVNFLHFLEDAAYKHAEKYGFGYSATYPNGYGWFMLRCHIKFEKFPKAWDNLFITTWAVEGKGAMCRRDFIAKDEQKNVVAKVATNWGLVNFDTKRLVNPFKTLNFPQLYPEYAFETNFEKIEAPAETTYSKEFEVRYDELDLNQHVNNAIYFGWAIDTMPFEFLSQNNVKEIEVAFKKEAHAGMKILSKVFYDTATKTSIHSIENAETNEELTGLKIKW